jgi:hypothetical protein
MGINITDKDANENAAPAVETVKLVLAGKVQRVHRQGKLYESGVTYTANKDQALVMLGWELDGAPMFKRWKKPEAQDRQGKIDNYFQREETISANAALLEQGAVDSKGRLSLSTEEEEAELFDHLDEDGPEGSENDGDGVPV